MNVCNLWTLRQKIYLSGEFKNILGNDASHFFCPLYVNMSLSLHILSYLHFFKLTEHFIVKNEFLLIVGAMMTNHSP